MKLGTLWIALLLALTGCKVKTVHTHSIKVKWHDATYSLSEYQEMQPGRPILAVFNADWGVMGALQRKILEEEEYLNILSESRFLCLWYDATTPDSLAHTEISRLNQNSIPFAVVVDGSSGLETVHHLPVNKDEMMTFLRSLKQ